MNPLKQRYLNRIRKESAYGALRTTLDWYWIICICVTALMIVPAIMMFMNGFGNDHQTAATLASLSAGILVSGFIFTRIGLLLIDIADSITDLNSRYEES